MDRVPIRGLHHHMLSACATCGSKLSHGHAIALGGGAWRVAYDCDSCDATDVPFIFRQFGCENDC